jgi:hypothetical protein
MSFNKTWDNINIRQFYIGLVTVFLDTTSVESKISILKWEKDDNHSSMIDLTLKGIFQCKQMNLIPIL